MECCRRTALDAVKAIQALTAIAGGVILAVTFNLAAGGKYGYFPASLAVLGGLLLLLGLAGSAGAWCGSYGPLHLTSGAFIVLLLLEAATVGLWYRHGSVLRKVAEADATGSMAAALDWVDAHPSAAACLAALWMTLQLLAVLLSTCLGCLPNRRRHKYPWSPLWDEDPAGVAAPLLPHRSPGSTARSARGYHTPPSRLGTPNASPFTSPARGTLAAAPPQQPQQHIQQQQQAQQQPAQPLPPVPQQQTQQLSPQPAAKQQRAELQQTPKQQAAAQRSPHSALSPSQLKAGASPSLVSRGSRSPAVQISREFPASHGLVISGSLSE